MKTNTKLVILNAGLIFGLLSVEGCATRRQDENMEVSRQKDTDTSHNYFTGSDTVTETDKSTYKNRDTGAVNNKKVTKKTKYDEYGNKISDSKEVDNDAAR